MQKNKRNVHDQRVTLMSLHLGDADPKAKGVGGAVILSGFTHSSPPPDFELRVKCERVRGGALHIFEIALYVLVCCE